MEPTAQLAGAVANAHPITIWGLFMQADFIVKFVMLLLLSALAATLTLVASAGSGNQGPWMVVDAQWLFDPLAGGGLLAPRSPLLDDFAPLVIVASSAAAGLVTSLACAPATRAGALTGTALATLILFSGYIAAGLVAAAWGVYDGWTPEAFLPHVGASLILMLLVTAAGPPVRAEPD